MLIQNQITDFILIYIYHHGKICFIISTIRKAAKLETEVTAFVRECFTVSIDRPDMWIGYGFTFGIQLWS
jgi:hypothetical protein